MIWSESSIIILAPMNVSFQTTIPELRCKMLHNRFAGDVMDEGPTGCKEAGITMNGQIVLCRGCERWRGTGAFASGMTGNADAGASERIGGTGGAYHVIVMDCIRWNRLRKEDALQGAGLIHSWQEKLLKEYGTHFIHAGDEWYILAERPMPEETTYDGYLQLENGVGMVRLLKEEVDAYLKKLPGDDRKRRVTIATGELAAPYLREHVASIRGKYPNVEVQVITVKNEFFGGEDYGCRASDRAGSGEAAEGKRPGRRTAAFHTICSIQR